MVGSKGDRPPKPSKNPYVVVCARCGKPTGEVVLPGKVSHYSCSGCGNTNILLQRTSGGCPNCKAFGTLTRIKGDVQIPENVNMGTVCVSCREQIEKHKADVAAGGIYWECKDCNSMGVITADAELAKIWRKRVGIPPPDPCGIQFSKEDACPACGPSKEEYRGQEAPQPKEDGKGPEGG